MPNTILTTNTIINTIKEHMSDIKKFSVEEIALFGSVARGEANENSDLDVLVLMKRKTLRDYMGLKFYLEELTGRKVDLVMAENLKPTLRQAILSEVISIEN